MPRVPYMSATARADYFLLAKAHDLGNPSSAIDEAWQMTYGDLGGLGPLSTQVVLVGDPGQIAPVVTGDPRRWRDWSAGPQRPAPEALLAAYPDSVTRLRLPHTWRLGPTTTALIQPAFYPDLPFDSRRPRGNSSSGKR